jgi:hypothetical protein
MCVHWTSYIEDVDFQLISFLLLFIYICLAYWLRRGLAKGLPELALNYSPPVLQDWSTLSTLRFSIWFTSNLHSHQKCVRILFCSCPCQHVLVLCFWYQPFWLLGNDILLWLQIAFLWQLMIWTLFHLFSCHL